MTSHFADNGSKLSNELIKALFLLTHDNVENALTFIKSSETKQNYSFMLFPLIVFKIKCTKYVWVSKNLQEFQI